MNPRYCLVCGVVDVAKRGAQTLYCVPCGMKANRRNGAGKARAAVSQAVRSGKLPPAKSCACVDCGGPALDYDHRDYNKPMEVEPVCRSCNKLRGPAKPVGAGLFTSKQKQFVQPNWTTQQTAA